MAFLLLPLLLATALPQAQSAGTDLDKLTALLRAKDQALLDATPSGDHAPYEQMLAADFVCADENSRIISREDFLKELTPFPKGISGNIVMSVYTVSRSGDTAIVIHHDDEAEHFFGNDLHAEYLTTETWQLQRGEWKMLVMHIEAIPVDAPTVTLTHAQIDELTGTYRARDLTEVIRRDGDRILLTRTGRPDVELKAETRDVLITPGQPRSINVFQRNAVGKVTGYAARRENRDLTWTRVE